MARKKVTSKSESAKKGWETRRANAIKKKRTEAAKKGWTTRKRLVAKVAAKSLKKSVRKKKLASIVSKLGKKKENRPKKIVHWTGSIITQQREISLPPYTVYEHAPHDRMIKVRNGNSYKIRVPYVQYHFGYGWGGGRTPLVTFTKKPYTTKMREVVSAMLPGMYGQGSYCAGGMHSNFGNNVQENYISAFWNSKFEYGSGFTGDSQIKELLGAKAYQGDPLRCLQRACKKNPDFFLEAEWPKHWHLPNFANEQMRRLKGHPYVELVQRERTKKEIVKVGNKKKAAKKKPKLLSRKKKVAKKKAVKRR